MQIFDLDVTPQATVDWVTLEAAHRITMNRYNQDLQERKPVPYMNAADRLEQAGILYAFDAPVTGISPQQAAAILNDYGFLASKNTVQAKPAEPALRRAIVLDPNRALARLNLADLLRERLHTVTNFSAKQRQVSEIKMLYRKYLQLGGNPSPRIDTIIKGGSREGAETDICQAIATYANASRL